MTTIPKSHADLFERPIVAALATVEPNGSPQVTPVWIDRRGDKLMINTAAGRRKYKNLLARPNVTVLLVDPDNDQRYLEVRGTVSAPITGQQADDDIDALARKYTGADRYPNRKAGEQRVSFLIQPERTACQMG